VSLLGINASGQASIENGRASFLAHFLLFSLSLSLSLSLLGF